MAEFNYRAVDAQGGVTSGTMSVDSEATLDARLSELGLWVIESRPVQDRRRVRKGASISRRELADFCAAMTSLLGAGVALAEALETMVEETANPNFKSTLSDVTHRIIAGNGLVESMAAYPKVFPAQMRNILEAGEFSGNLTGVFADLAKHYEWIDQLVGQAKQATIYPTAVLGAVIAFVMLLFTFVVPRFAKVMEDLDVSLPLATRLVLETGNFVQTAWWALLLVPLGALLFLMAVRRSSAGRLLVDAAKLKLPIFGKLQLLIVLSRMSHNLALLARSGVPLLNAVGLCRELVGNEVVARALEEAERAITEGEQLSDVIRRHPVFPPLLLRMVVVGEQTGRMDETLEHLSRRYEEELPRTVKQVFGVMEPVLIIILVGVVGFVALSLFLPLLSLMDHMG